MNVVNTLSECPKCGTTLKSYHKFCPVCGEDLNVHEIQPPIDPPLQLPSQMPVYPDQTINNYQPNSYQNQNVNNVYANQNGGYADNYPNNNYNQVNQYPHANYSNPAIDVYNAKPKKSYKNLIIWIATSVAIVVAAVTAILVIKHFSDKKAAEELKKSQELAYEEYMDDAYDFYIGISADAVKLAEIGSDVEKYWYDAIWENEYGGDVDLAVDNALLINSSDLTTIKSNYGTYELLYEELSEIPEGEKKSEIEDAREEITNLWNAYDDLYSIVTEPAGSIVTFGDDLKAADQELADVISDCEYIIYGN